MFSARYLRHALFAVCLIALPAAAEMAGGAMGVVSQAQGLPSDFEQHFFDVPLAVRVDLDGRYLGDAMIVLSRDEQVQLLEFTDYSESRELPSLRRRWQERLAEGRPLGNCQRDCADGLQAIHYSLVNSQLSLLTDAAERTGSAPRYYTLPDEGGGLLLRNQLNLVSDSGETSGVYSLQGQGSLGAWTTLADAQVDRGGSDDDRLRHRLSQLYAERLSDDHFYRLGYFTPIAQGLTRQPRLMGRQSDTTLGLMFGSSDGLLVDNGQTSSTPIHVTPNRPGIVEIYRNGVLINSQPVQPGLQALDTKVLPAGIYQVEVRLLEDGQETSRSQEFVYKPNSWRNLDSRWRYNAYVGQQAQLFSNWEESGEDSLNAGVSANYLLHPRAIVGGSVQQVSDTTQYGVSLDWDALDRVKLYGNVYRSDGQGSGYDLQVINNHELGSLVLSRSKSWLEEMSRPTHSQMARYAEQSQTSVLFTRRISNHSTATLRVSRSTGSAEGVGVDMGWSYYGKLFGSDANWRLNVFDRPGTRSSGDERSRGVNLTLSMSLGQGGERIAASIGSRTSHDGGRDHNATVSYMKDVDLGALRSLGASATVDRYGAGLGGNAQFQGQALYGDVYAQSSSYNGELSAGLNLQNIVAVGEGKVAVTGQYLPHDAGLIVDVESDIPNLDLRADGQYGSSTSLKPGRNVVPVQAYKAGYVQFDLDNDGQAAAVIQPSSLDYHLNRGGVTYRKLRVLRTVTVLGRLIDAHGQPMGGAQVVNHASRSVAESGGMFAVEMSESTPTLEVRQGGTTLCLLSLDPNTLTREGDVLLAGDLSCNPDSLAQAPSRSGAQRS
ncbi:TcfC E-set like domain-containing protein [Pseudomonas cremoricolorata]|uniref:Pilus assembly protein PapC n=1 Tax=Pseudomonas cremoricolorata TaxID=157783 RepID=A0A089WYK0_9PSED|nr:TcfC E-set like domain-containing protein [Pseudomonas cremoricolorata]AIR91712.1 pilus assembly protein PapC [Pseudomonas cremoricolorata]